MRLLLDTHTLIWLIEGDARLSHAASAAVLGVDNEIFVSAVSPWEIAIKVSVGKLTLGDGWEGVLERELRVNRIRRLGIEGSHCSRVAKLPFHHRDPFDRMLVAQCQVEGLALVTKDAALNAYGIEVIW